MFGAKLSTKISHLGHRVIAEGDNLRRVDRLVLQTELDDELAAGIGEAAQDALKHLRDGSMKSGGQVYMNAMKVKIECSAGEVKDGKHSVAAAGVKAVLNPSRKEGASPMAKLVFEFATRTEDHEWFIKHLEENVSTKITKVQLTLAGTEKPAKKAEA
jgi:hypothetical protein